MIWMRSGVHLLLSKILATGLFEHNLRLNVGRGHSWILHQVRRGDRMVTVLGVPSPDPSWNEQFTKATPDQTRPLARIQALVADRATSEKALETGPLCFESPIAGIKFCPTFARNRCLTSLSAASVPPN